MLRAPRPGNRSPPCEGGADLLDYNGWGRARCRGRSPWLPRGSSRTLDACAAASDVVPNLSRHTMSSTLSVVEPYPARDGATPTPASVNDLAIRVGTVNGSGSQSANLVLLRALYGMGIPCSGKNVFPSNIEGLPTWFHIRASARGYVGHRSDTPILVCMNEQTAADDVRLLRPGALCIYRDDLKQDLRALRSDVSFVPVPLQKLVEQAYPPDPKD